MQVNENISAVITGGASGLGEATARELSKRGVKCSLFDLNVEKGEAVASEINGTFCEVNVTEEESVVKGFEKARKENPEVGVIVIDGKQVEELHVNGAKKLFPKA